MRYLILAVLVLVVFVSCKKNKYTTAPQIKFKSITSVVHSSATGAPSDGPKLTIEVTDAEGDLGFNIGKDTSYVYIKNLNVPGVMDSFKFPASLTGAVKKNLKADVEIALEGNGTAGSGVVKGNCVSVGCTDTLYFEVYVKDFAKNKSNVIRTEKPLYFIRP